MRYDPWIRYPAIACLVGAVLVGGGLWFGKLADTAPVPILGDAAEWFGDLLLLTGLGVSLSAATALAFVFYSRRRARW